MKSLICALASLMLFAATAGHSEDCFDVGPDQGEVSFQIDQAGSTFSGTFENFGGRVCMNGATVERVEAWVEPGSVKAGLPEIEDALRGDEFFAVKQHPRATFDSTTVDKTPDGYLAHGTLQVKGISNPVDVPFTLSDGAGGRRVQGALELHRLDFDVGTGEWADTQWVGETATVQFAGQIP